MIEILITALLSAVLIAWMHEIAVHYKTTRTCKHLAKLNYHSLKLHQCVDCGIEIAMDDQSAQIKHQR